MTNELLNCILVVERRRLYGIFKLRRHGHSRPRRFERQHIVKYHQIPFHIEAARWSIDGTDGFESQVTRLG